MTDITNDKVKQFAYTAEFSDSGNRGGGWRGGMGGGGRRGMGGGGMGGGGMGGGGMGGGTGGWGGRGGMGGSGNGNSGSNSNSGQGNQTNQEDRQSRMLVRYEQMMDNKLNKLGFCHDGYEITDSNISRGHVQIMGKCRDQASAEDIQKFKNQNKSNDS